MGDRLTISDIARLAGVSKATVSRVLNHKPDVDPATRDRIMRIMNEQGFVPNSTAAGLAGGKSRLIGVLVPALTWPLIPEIMRGIAEIVEQTSYELVLYSIKGSFHEVDRGDVIDRILATKLTAGLLAIFPGQSAQHLPTLHRQGFPVVMLDDQGHPLTDIPWVSADNRSGAYAATRHLIELGHRRIAHIQGPIKYQVSLDRYQGYCDALSEAGIALDPELVLQGDFMATGGRTCARQFLSLLERPTAIFAGSDLMAFGVMGAAEEFGLRIPEDVSLIGFDDIPSASHMQPLLTTVRQPLYEMGQVALELLISLVEKPREIVQPSSHTSPTLVRYLNTNRQNFTHLAPEEQQPARAQLATHLVVRASTAPPRVARHIRLATDGS